MAKLTSGWIDNTKIRNRLYDFNQSVRKVYNCYRYIGPDSNGRALILPLTPNSIKSRPLYNNTFFLRYDEHFPFLNNCAIDDDNLNNALKKKAYEYEKHEDGNWLIKDDENQFKVSLALKEDQIVDCSNYPAFEAFDSMMNDGKNYLGQYVLTAEDINNLVDYKVLTKEIATDNGVPVEFVMAKEIFPVIGKADLIKIHTARANITEDEGKDKIYRICIQCDSEAGWSLFMLNYIYGMDN